MTEKTSALEKLTNEGLELVGEFKGFQIWAKGHRRALYDIKERRVFMTYNEDDDICEYINEWSRIKKEVKMKLDCPYIKGCGFKDSAILHSCRKGGYTDCSIYLSNVKEEK